MDFGAWSPSHTAICSHAASVTGHSILVAPLRRCAVVLGVEEIKVLSSIKI